MFSYVMFFILPNACPCTYLRGPPVFSGHKQQPYSSDVYAVLIFVGLCCVYLYNALR